MTKAILLVACASITVGTAVSAEKTFLFRNSSHDISEFRAFARMAGQLKPYGDVQVDIGVLADKSWYEMPEGGSPWHEYANNGSCMAKFFPHPKIAPFIPADWVARNKELLLAKAAVLRELGLNAVFTSDDTHFLPEAFFQKYPHLRGPRVDHPRRSRQEAFAWCTDMKETREMVEWMAAELKRQVPEIKTMISHSNDAGGGFCWAAALYTGPNGPHSCENRSAGIRVKEFAEAIHRGAEKGGGKISIRLDGNFWQHEDDEILPLLPPDTYIAERDRGTVHVHSLLNEAYPIRGLFDPLAVIAALGRLNDAGVRTIVIDTTAWYARTDDSLETAAKLVEIVKESLAQPANGAVPQFSALHRLALRWGGEKHADALVDAFHAMNEAFRLKAAAAPGYSNMYAGVSMRHLTRPLLLRPETLAPAEESYFLPYVFNPFLSEARSDYIDLHGMRMKGPSSWDDAGLRQALSRALSAAGTLEGANGAPEEKWLRRLGLALKIWVSEVRSINNFYFAQLLRDRNKAVLAGEPRMPPKEYTWTGANDYLDWNEIQRDEFDNTNELIALAEGEGLNVIARAADARHEDTFLMGPDFIGALREKSRLMRRGWSDVQNYLTSPNK